MTEDERSRDELPLADLARDLGPNQVFGPVAQQGGTTLVPVAQVRASGGFGGRKKPVGGGGNIVARPVGAWSVTADGVEWHAAVSVNRIVLGGQLAAAAALVAGFIAFRRKR
ncbi:hypothetical protein INP57_03160 [Saccharopolyspora sp. HNM0986]|uniref:hypothetical protein n=1 Tax=Saccharopolyspora galaxeae TaxID=2781241 RepID=UPI00190C98EB|nr:hypothetical protein [Saccharopolyspora sp. HNM0986]MBK0865798.1 hypothetical protein [Saccharopolyspora sp. HNM0986]